MEIKKLNGLNIIVSSQYELILAILAVYLKQHPELAEDKLYWIEIPPIPYIGELEKIIDSVQHQNLINQMLEFKDEAAAINIAICLDDNFEIIKSKVNHNIDKYVGYEEFQKFAYSIKVYAKQIGWNDFFEKHKDFYLSLASSFCNFPLNLDLKDIENFYSTKIKSYTYIPSILMNGGFGSIDGEGNQYYVRGIEFDKEKRCFIYDSSYLCECLFHEFSHPIVNPIVDKYFHEFTNIDEIHSQALKNGLPNAYSGQKKTMLYEYFVRANAHILNLKYYKDTFVSDWILTHGFEYLNDLIDYTIKNKDKYNSYEDFFKEELIYYMNNIMWKKEIRKK